MFNTLEVSHSTVIDYRVAENHDARFDIPTRANWRPAALSLAESPRDDSPARSDRPLRGGDDRAPESGAAILGHGRERLPDALGADRCGLLRPWGGPAGNGHVGRIPGDGRTAQCAVRSPDSPDAA